MRLTAAGLAAGLLGASWLTRSLASLLYQVGATDPATYLLIALALGLVVTIAVWIPTRRVLRIEPVAALKSD